MPYCENEENIEDIKKQPNVTINLTEFLESWNKYINSIFDDEDYEEDENNEEDNSEEIEIEIDEDDIQIDENKKKEIDNKIQHFMSLSNNLNDIDNFFQEVADWAENLTTEEKKYTLIKSIDKLLDFSNLFG